MPGWPPSKYLSWFKGPAQRRRRQTTLAFDAQDNYHINQTTAMWPWCFFAYVNLVADNELTHFKVRAALDKALPLFCSFIESFFYWFSPAWGADVTTPISSASTNNDCCKVIFLTSQVPWVIPEAWNRSRERSCAKLNRENKSRKQVTSLASV